MTTYSKIHNEHNAELEFEFESWQGDRPTALAIRHVVKKAGVSQTHARAHLIANTLVGTHGD